MAARAPPQTGTRSRARRAGHLVLALTALTVLLALLAAPAAFAKSYSMPQVTIEGTVRPDGSLQVVEIRTFDFSGTYHFVYWDLQTSGAQDIRVQGVSTPSQTFTRSDSGAPGTYSVGSPPVVRVQANFELSDTSVPFTLRYVVKGAAKRYSDTAELYWQFIGDQWEHRRRRGDDHHPPAFRRHARPGARLGPRSAERHGDDQPRRERDPARHRPAAVHVRRGTRALPRRGALGGGALRRRAAAERPRRGEAPGRRRQRRARRGAAQDPHRRDRRAGRSRRPGSLLWLFLFLRFGREHKPSFTAQYYRDIPEEKLPPALVGYLWKMGSIANPEMTATLLDLADRGALELRDAVAVEHHLLGDKEKQTYQLVLHREKYDSLQPHERALVDLLFRDMGIGRRRDDRGAQGERQGRSRDLPRRHAGVEEGRRGAGQGQGLLRVVGQGGGRS